MVVFPAPSGPSIPGFTFPTIVGPFNYIDLRARLSQTVVDLTAWKNYKSANETLHSTQLSSQDSRDLVVLAVGGAYLEVSNKTSDVNNYPWQSAYTAAISEADSAILCDRIKEALEVMRARAYAVGIGSPEYHDLQDAKNALATLNAERADGAV